MKVTKVLSTILLLCAALGRAQAAAPAKLPVQGYLTDPGGVPITASKTIGFKVFGQATGGTALYTEPDAAYTVDEGVFTVTLGSRAALDLSVFRSTGVAFLQVTVEGQDLMPRIEIGSVPYAAWADTAGDAATVGGLAPSAFARYRSTIVVSPAATALASGTALLSAVNTTVGTAAAPLLIKVEPGFYDLGTNMLSMRPYVDLEGSGEMATIITSSGPETMDLYNGEARWLTVQNTAPGGGVTLRVPSNQSQPPRLTRVRVVTNALGMAVQGGLIMDQVHVIGNAVAYLYGIGVATTAPVILRRSAIEVTASGAFAVTGINVNGNLDVRDTTISATSSAGAFGISITSGRVDLDGLSITTGNGGVSASGFGAGVWAQGGPVTIANTRIVAADYATQYGIYCQSVSRLAVRNVDVLATSSVGSPHVAAFEGGRDCPASISASTLQAVASGGAAYGVLANLGAGSRYTVELDNTIVAGTHFGVVASLNAIATVRNSVVTAQTTLSGAGIFQVGQTQLNATTATASGGGIFHCMFSYKSDFVTALTSACL